MNQTKLAKLRETLRDEFEAAHGKGSFTKLYMSFNADDEVLDCDIKRTSHQTLILYLLAYGLRKHPALQGMLTDKFMEQASLPWEKGKFNVKHTEPYRILEIARRYADDFLEKDPDQGFIPYDPQTIPDLAA